jgi:hypothetical protein
MTEQEEKSLSETEKENRYKMRSEHEDDKYEINLKMSDTCLQVYKCTMFKYYNISKTIRTDQKKKIYKIKKVKTETLAPIPDFDVLKKILYLSGGIVFAYILYKKKKFKYY